MSALTVVKIGGNVIDDPARLEAFAKRFSQLPGPKLLVHGGGKEASRMMRDLGIEVRMVDGRRITDADALRIVTMVYAGLINKRIVGLLQRFGCDAVGLCGADGHVLTARRRPAEPIDFGFVGDVSADGVNADFLGSLVDGGRVPVMCAITAQSDGTLLNSNADSVASAIASGMARVRPTRLWFCFEKPGVLADVDRDDSVIPLITPASYPALRESGAVSAGMIPKIDGALAAVAQGVEQVVIKSDADLLADAGTTICA